jgi:hypothetical protein
VGELPDIARLEDDTGLEHPADSPIQDDGLEPARIDAQPGMLSRRGHPAKQVAEAL